MMTSADDPAKDFPRTLTTPDGLAVSDASVGPSRAVLETFTVLVMN